MGHEKGEIDLSEVPKNENTEKSRLAFAMNLNNITITIIVYWINQSIQLGMNEFLNPI